MNIEKLQLKFNSLSFILNNFDVKQLQNKLNLNEIQDNIVIKLLDDIYSIEEDLIILNCIKKE